MSMYECNGVDVNTYIAYYCLLHPACFRVIAPSCRQFWWNRLDARHRGRIDGQ